MRKREEERRAKEAEQKRREDAARRLAELRAKDAKERSEREKEKERREREVRERKERMEAERLAQDLEAKLLKERRERERLEKEAKEAREREALREKEAREAEEKKKKEAQEREERRKKLAADRETLRKKEAEEARIREEQRKQREKEKADKEKAEKEAQEAKERAEKEKAEKERAEREKAVKEKLEKERIEKERAEKEKAEKEKAEREKAEREKAEREKAEKENVEKEAGNTPQSPRAGTYAFSGVGQRMSMWPNGRPPVPAPAPSTTSSAAPSTAPSAAAPPPTSSPKKATASTTASSSTPKKPAPSTARSGVSGVSTESSYRPYDKAKKPQHKKSASSLGSESSWAASHSTARTSPPPSVRSCPYTTKDPDKIVISAVYLFMNQYAKTPASQLISGVGPVTDGLILRITTEGLFIDDDVRSVPQREWDVKAWTLKQVEVWCPPHCLNSPSSPSPSNPNFKTAASRARDRGGSTKPLTGVEADVYLTEMLLACNETCRHGLCERKLKETNMGLPSGQTGEWKTKGLHVLRATIRDQEGKRYVFVIDETESWKVAAGLQRLRKGSQVRQLAVSGMSASDARGTLEMVGW